MTVSSNAGPAKTSSRGRAPAVPPVDLAGVRYEPLQSASSDGLPPGVYIKATDMQSDQRLWTAKLWDTSIDATREADIQNIFVRSLTPDANAGLLRAEDESGRNTAIDLKTGQLRTEPQLVTPSAYRVAPPRRPKPAFQAKRVGPPTVAPLIIGSVRFEAIHWGRERGLPQNGGYVAAVEVPSGNELWIAKIYTVDYEPGLETDVQDVFIKSMTAGPTNHALLITDERNRRFMLDLESRIVRAMP